MLNSFREMNRPFAGRVPVAIAVARPVPAADLRQSGGTTDALGRVLAVSLGERLGPQVVVENPK
jgi:hypothetical protein